MKTRFTLFVFLLLSLSGLNAQTGFFGEPVVPLKPQSPLFGKDIIINNQPGHDQGNVAICSAFNGWLFAGYSYDTLNEQRVLIMKSVDNGIHWSRFIDWADALVNEIHPKIDIVCCGSNIEGLKIIVGDIWHDTISGQAGAFVCSYNASTGSFERRLLYELPIVNDLALASDNTSSGPGTLGILMSKSWSTHDNVTFLSSSDGGLTLDNRRDIASTQNAFIKVSLAFGKSLSTGSGRYFASWEEQASQTSTTGHIYTAHSEPNFNSPFTIPVCLDSLDPSSINKVRNPAIACQYNNVDNDSANLTEVVLFEKYKSASDDYDVTGFYNLQATTTSHFRHLNIAGTSNNELQPDINFNLYNSTFMMTFFDSTEKKLPFLTNDVNLANPNSWNVNNQGYNDNSNLVAPYPKVDLNVG